MTRERWQVVVTRMSGGVRPLHRFVATREPVRPSRAADALSGAMIDEVRHMARGGHVRAVVIHGRRPGSEFARSVALWWLDEPTTRVTTVRLERAS